MFDMQTYPTSCTLIKDWVSHRGKLYCAGTMFRRDFDLSSQSRPDEPGHWYRFETPKNLPLPYASCFGFVYIPNRIFMRPTKEEIEIRKEREKYREKHFKKQEFA